MRFNYFSAKVLSFHRKREKISYWRTKTGYEVDFIIGDTIAIEVKISQDIKKRKMELAEGKSIIIMPWRDFLTDLWSGNIIK